MRFAVLLKGTLRGMGREAECELLAIKNVVPGTNRPSYSHCAVIEAPVDLLDGDYEVEFADEVAVTRLHRGSWQVARVMPRTYAEAATFFASEARRVSGTVRRPSEIQQVMSASRKARASEPSLANLPRTSTTH